MTVEPGGGALPLSRRQAGVAGAGVARNRSTTTTTDAARALRMRILATEHWSLLATRAPHGPR